MRTAKVVGVAAAETAIKRQITDYLDAKGIYWERMQSGKVKSERGSWMQLCRKGTADLLAAPMAKSDWLNDDDQWEMYPTFLWIEVKKPGEKQNADQIAFEADVKSRGMHYLVATSFEDVEKYLETL